MQTLPTEKTESLRTNVAAATVCRLCLLSVMDSGCMEPNIFHSSEIYSIAEKIARVTRLSLFEGDGLPTTVCQQCIFELNIAYSFIQKCTQSNMSLQSKINPREHEISCDCNFESKPLGATCNGTMLTPPSEDFLLALEYVEFTQNTDLNENIPSNSTELQVPTIKPEENLDECAFFQLDNFPEYAADLDEVGEISVKMEDFQELSYWLTDGDFADGCYNPLITPDDTQQGTSGVMSLAVKKHSESSFKEISNVDITGSYGHTSSGPEDVCKRKSEGSQDHDLCKNMTVIPTTLSDTTSSCRSAVEEPKTLLDKNQSPSTIQQLDTSRPKAQQINFPRLTKSEKKLLTSQNAAKPRTVCDQCSSTFLSKGVLNMHKQTQACERKRLKLQNSENKRLPRRNLAKARSVNHLVLDSKVTAETLKCGMSTTNQFLCNFCGCNYKLKPSLIRHMKVKHLQK